MQVSLIKSMDTTRAISSFSPWSGYKFWMVVVSQSNRLLARKTMYYIVVTYFDEHWDCRCEAGHFPYQTFKLLGGLSEGIHTGLSPSQALCIMA